MEFEYQWVRHSRPFESLNLQQNRSQNLKFRKVMPMLNKYHVTKPYVCGCVYIIVHFHHPGQFILGESDPWVHRIGDRVRIEYKNNPCISRNEVKFLCCPIRNLLR